MYTMDPQSCDIVCLDEIQLWGADVFETDVCPLVRE